MSTLPLLPTTVVGSHCKPGWWHLVQEEACKGNLGPTDLQEALDTAVDIAILDQERAGIDIISDGEMRRGLHFYRTYYARLQGVQTAPPQRRLGEPGYDTRESYQVVGRIAAPEGMGIVREFEYLKAHTRRPTKVTCAGPQTFTWGVTLRDGYRDDRELLYDFARIINAELRALAAAGATFIQVDEPAFTRWAADGKTFAEIYNATVEGVQAKLALHICFGNHHGRPTAKRTYRPLFPGVLAARADQFVLEFANRELAEIALWKEFGDGRELGAGLLDQKSYYIETPEDIAERIRVALRYVPRDKLYINPDCGLHPTPRWVGLQKLRNMVEGARIVRRELGAE